MRSNVCAFAKKITVIQMTGITGNSLFLRSKKCKLTQVQQGLDKAITDDIP